MNNICIFLGWRVSNIKKYDNPDPSKIRVNFKGTAPEPEKGSDGEPIWNSNWFTAWGKEAQIISQYVTEGKPLMCIEAEQRKYCKFEKDANGNPLKDANGNPIRTFKDNYTVKSIQFYPKTGTTYAQSQALPTAQATTNQGYANNTPVNTPAQPQPMQSQVQAPQQLGDYDSLMSEFV